MDSLIFATNNAHKVSEISHMLGDLFKIRTLKELGLQEDIPETGNTFQANASQKAHFIYERFQSNCFADDSGLEVDALNGAPGIYSARYSGSRDMDQNIHLLLKNMEHESQRSAAFKTVISLIYNGEEYLFEGSVKGMITLSPRGAHGFGYDPIFVPQGYNETFAEMDASLKDTISHRSIAVNKLVQFLLGSSTASS